MTSLYPRRPHIKDVITLSEDSIRVTSSSVLGSDSTIDINVSFDTFDHWATRDDVMIQEAMPDVSADHREFLLTGMTSEQWDAVFNVLDRSCGDENSITNDETERE